MFYYFNYDCLTCTERQRESAEWEYKSYLLSCLVLLICTYFSADNLVLGNQLESLSHRNTISVSPRNQKASEALTQEMGPCRISSILIDLSGLLWPTALLRCYTCSFPITCIRHNLSENILYLRLRQKFYPILWDSWDLGTGLCCRCINWSWTYAVVSCPHFDQLWFLVTVSLCCKKKILWKVVGATISCGNKEKYYGNVVHIDSGELLSYKEKWNNQIWQ